MDPSSILERFILLTGITPRPRPGTSWRRESSFRAGRCSRVLRQALEHEGRPPGNGNAGDNLANFLSNNPSNIYELRCNHPFTTHGKDAFFVKKLVIAAHLRSVIHAPPFDAKLPVKKMVTGINTADLLLKAMKAVHGVIILLEAQGGDVSALGSPDGLLLGLKAAKVVFKGVKMSQKALESHGVKSGLGDRFSSMMNGLKASWGALDLVRGSRAILSEFSSGRFAAVNLFLRGYEACKGAVSTAEVLGPFKVSGLKNALKGIGVMIKAWVVSKELYVLLIKGLGLSHGTRAALKIISEGRRRQQLASRSKSLVSFRRRRGVNLVTEVEGGGIQMNVESSLRVCHSLFINTWRLQNQSELSLLSIQGLSSL